MIHLYAGARHLYGKAGMELIGIGQFRLPLITDTVILLTFQSKKNIVLTGIKIVLSILIDI